MTQFFKKMPLVTYEGASAVNIMSRVNLTKMAVTAKQAYYDYTLTDGQRLDNLSFDYYNNPDYFWLIALCNQIIDPYYGIPLSDQDLSAYIVKKYGSASAAQNKILFFRNNWVGDDSNLSLAAYEALPVTDSVNLKKYWAPQVDADNITVSYVRKPEDWIVSTNAYYQLEVTDSSDFVIGEVVQQDDVDIATVAAIYPGILMIHHVGVTPVTGTITGKTASTTVNSVALVTKNIPDAEFVYWAAISAYDYEQELNTQKKTIKLLDNKYSGQAAKELKSLLQS